MPQRHPSRPSAPLTATLILVSTLLASNAGCTDIRDYEGTWTGGIVTNPTLRDGFDANTLITLEISRIDRSDMDGRVTLGPAQDVTAGFTDATLIPVSRAGSDVLGDLTFDGDPIATYLFHLAPDDPDEEHATVLISAHPNHRLEVRIFRHDLYGVFRLRR